MQSYILCAFLFLFAFCGNSNATSSAVLEEEIQIKLIEAFPDAEDFTRLLWHLDQEKNAYKDFLDNAPTWRTLKTILKSANFNTKSSRESAFKKYAQFMIEDTKTAKKDAKFYTTMNLMYGEMLDASDDPLASDAHQGMDYSNVGSGSNFIRVAMGLLPVGDKDKFVKSVSKFASTGKVTSLVKPVGNQGLVGLASVHLSWEVYISIGRWWNGEISGVRCTKTIVDAAATIGGGVGGCAAGAAIGGAFAGPPGAFFGTIIGGVVGAELAGAFSDRLTQAIFGLPKEVALENAYKYLGVPMTASNTQVNTAYRALCKKHHPDRSGQSEEFLLVQVHMTVIKKARENL